MPCNFEDTRVKVDNLTTFGCYGDIRKQMQKESKTPDQLSLKTEIRMGELNIYPLSHLSGDWHCLLGIEKGQKQVRICLRCRT